jgi:MarR family transcriptional regulator, organic hydroperoxide resistance regulator
MDFVKSLGALTLAHRFYRLMNRLLDAHETVYQSLDLPIKPRWVSTLLLLHEHGPMAVTDIAEQLHLTHPAVNQLAQDIAAAGLIADAKDKADGRKRLLRLTPKAVQMLPTLQQVWAELDRTQRAVFKAGGCDILAVLDAVEERLEHTPLSAMVLKRLEKMTDATPVTPRR